MKVKVKDLIGVDVDGISADIKSHGTKYHYDYQDIPQIRVLKRVAWKSYNGVNHLEWYWRAEGFIKPYDTPDCGFSGFASPDDIEGLYLELVDSDVANRKDLQALAITDDNQQSRML